MTFIRNALILALLVLTVGVLIQVGPRVPGLRWVGKLPGDLQLRTRQHRYSIPIASCLIVAMLVELFLKLLPFIVR